MRCEWVRCFFLFAREFRTGEIPALPTSSCRWTRSSASRHQHGLGKTLLGHLHMPPVGQNDLDQPRCGSVYYGLVPHQWAPHADTAPHADRCFVGIASKRGLVCRRDMVNLLQDAPKSGGIQRKSTFTAKFCGSSSFTRILYFIGTYIQDR